MSINIFIKMNQLDFVYCLTSFGYLYDSPSLEAMDARRHIHVSLHQAVLPSAT